MAVSADVYGNVLPQALTGAVNVTGHTLKMALLAGYTPNLTADVHYSDVSAHEITGTGYTAGGASLTGVTVTATAAASWSQGWNAAHAFAYGALIAPGTGFLYRCVQAGTTGGGAPTFPTTVGLTVTDSGVIWACAGTVAVVLNSARVTWANAIFSTDHAVLYDSSTGVLIMVQAFGGTEAPVAETFYLAPDPILGWANWVIS